MAKVEGYVKSIDEIPSVNMNINLPAPDKMLRVREIFYEPQGEGSRAGEMSIFIRLSYCNKNCWYCDTDWSKGTLKTVDSIRKEIGEFPCKKIVFTGGEPLLQLDEEIIKYFKDFKYFLAIETNGTLPPLKGLDYISTSPKGTVKILNECFPDGINGEIRYPIEVGKFPPDIKDLPKANYYYISPLFLGEQKERFELVDDNLKYCLDFIRKNPEWRISVQQHKLWGIR